MKTLEFAIFENHSKRCSFGLFRPRDHDVEHGACLPVNFAPCLIQIRWTWTHFKGMLVFADFSQNNNLRSKRNI
jgi:hypothetical protein